MASEHSVHQLLQALLDEHLTESGRAFWAKAQGQVADGAQGQTFANLLAMASRHAKRQPLGLTDTELAAAEGALPGWSPRAWNRLELLRINLILARPDLEQASFAEEFEALFRFADEGETCALYRSLPLLPRGERFTWRAAEACRTNMLTVFEAVALDSPYPVTHFDDTAWHQLVIKALFLDCPLYRVSGLDQRLTPELTRMALDWAEERHSAGRYYHLGLWLCLGPHHPERVRQLLEQHWPEATTTEQQAMLLGAARAGQTQWLASVEPADPKVLPYWQNATAGRSEQAQFAPLFAELPSA
ncbi:EboA domain-containing protein [Marinimicrobium sp. LS-A18]|uniref:EboA domain-containing protein n=1 Tax=Marinimicrobium sp. LS-A18 TaxID=1381596 RepID=UPI0004BB8097|nr:EboA domain-containing protein [Marinimicrobium sp. LS-A18]